MKLIITYTMYVWSKDSVEVDPRYRIVNDDEYLVECKEYGVNTLDGCAIDNWGRVILDQNDIGCNDGYKTIVYKRYVFEISDEESVKFNEIISQQREIENKIYEARKTIK